MMANVSALLHLYVPIFGAIVLAHLCLGREARAEYWLRLSAIAVGLTGIAFFLPSLLLLHLVMFAVVPLTARRNVPGDAAAIYLFTMLLLPGLGTDLYLGGTRLWYQDIDQTLGLGALVTVLMHRRPSAVSLVRHLPFLCIFMTALIASARDTSFTHLLRAILETFLVYGVPYMVVVRSIRTQDDIRRVMTALAIGGAVLSAVLVFEAALTWPFYRQLYAQYGLDVSNVSVHLRAGLIRAAGPFIEPIACGVVLCFCFFSAWLSRDRFKSKTHQMMFLALLVAGLIAPQSRSAWIGLLIGIMAIDYFRKRYGPFWRNVTILSLAVAVVLPLAFANQRVAEMVGLGEEAIGSADYRQQLLDRGLEEVAKHPLTGQPLEKVIASLEDLRTGENIVDFVNSYLYWALILGIPGVLIFAGALIGALLSAWRLRGRSNGPASAFLVAGLSAQIIMLAFLLASGRVAIMVVALMAMTAVFPLRAKAPARRRAASRPPLLAEPAGIGHMADSSSPRSTGPALTPRAPA